MSYMLNDLAADCHAAMAENQGPAGREKVRQCIERALKDQDFVASQFGPENEDERKVVYEDPEFGFCILAHVYKGAKGSNPHDHGPSWAIYGQAIGQTEMTDWRKVMPPQGDEPGVVEHVKVYDLEPGVAHLYNEGDLHSPRRENDTKLIRVEGMNLAGVKRDRYVVAS